MKKQIQILLIILTAILFFTACEEEEEEEEVNLPVIIDAFNNGTSERNLIVVMSDLHLGADIAYSEINENLKPLENFLNKIKESANVKELVIAGDMLDEWFIPADIDTYNGKDQRDFIQRIAATNKTVIDLFNSIIQEEKVLVTYVPGNHDLTITEENIELILPGINQSRDAELGLGTYSPNSYPEIAIEHGHRYNYFCAPDPFSNQDIAPGTIMPPGYFFTRIATQHVVQECSESTNAVDTIMLNPSILGNDSQISLFAYYSLWKTVVNDRFPIENTFDEKMIITNVNGHTQTYSVNDLIPFQKDTSGLISVNLYAGAQDTWAQRCVLNHVPVSIPVIEAIKNAASTAQTDRMAESQYFKNPNSDKKLVVFGHSHVPTIKASTDHLGEKTIYANSGTWIDHNTLDTISAMNFVVITPQNNVASSQTYVKLYQFKNEIVAEMATESLEL
jgi:UDP-2,3-diacylglucosamine pyrophosphatase LpxH